MLPGRRQYDQVAEHDHQTHRHPHDIPMHRQYILLVYSYIVSLPVQLLLQEE